MGKQSTEGSGNPFSERKIVLCTEEGKEVLFKRNGIFLQECQGSKGSALQTQIDYFSIPGSRGGKNLVTLTQISNEQCLVLTKESEVLKTSSMSMEDFTNKKNDIAKELQRSSNSDTNIAQRHLFFAHVEADRTVQFQSFDKNYYLSESQRRLQLQQIQGNEAGLRFFVKHTDEETSLP